MIDRVRNSFASGTRTAVLSKCDWKPSRPCQAPTHPQNKRQTQTHLVLLGERAHPSGEFFQRYFFRERNSAFSDWNSRVALHNCHWRNGLRDYAACGYDGAAANDHIWKDDDAWTNKRVLLDFYPLRLAKMRDR